MSGRTQRDWTVEEWRLYFKGIDPNVYYAPERREEANSKPLTAREKRNLIPESAKRWFTWKGEEVESIPNIMIGKDCHVTINRYDKDETKWQVFVSNFKTEYAVNGTMDISQVNDYIVYHIRKSYE